MMNKDSEQISDGHIVTVNSNISKCNLLLSTNEIINENDSCETNVNDEKISNIPSLEQKCSQEEMIVFMVQVCGFLQDELFIDEMKRLFAEEIGNVFDIPLFLNPNITYGNKMLYLKTFIEAGVCKIKDIAYECKPGFLKESYIQEIVLEKFPEVSENKMLHAVRNVLETIPDEYKVLVEANVHVSKTPVLKPMIKDGVQICSLPSTTNFYYRMLVSKLSREPKFRNVNLTFDLAYSTGQKHLSSIRKILLSNSKTHCEIRTAVLGIPCLAVNRLSYGDRIVSDIRIVYLYLAVTFDRQKTCKCFVLVI
ncbi:unnamed protein product [Mytilus edulis]|uniref:Uncharacterized protein n=1 Tax=Mytilus edulis TaxID=6550 RepID=A0A8S3UBR5_MYTED|nr:unnamed protein product [Mytilus edulis]